MVWKVVREAKKAKALPGRVILGSQGRGKGRSKPLPRAKQVTKVISVIFVLLRSERAAEGRRIIAIVIVCRFLFPRNCDEARRRPRGAATCRSSGSATRTNHRSLSLSLSLSRWRAFLNPSRTIKKQ